MADFMDQNFGTYRKQKRRLVAWSPSRRMYLRYDCTGFTADRTYAWSGRDVTQARNMREAYPAARECDIVYDGEEKSV